MLINIILIFFFIGISNHFVIEAYFEANLADLL